jgi:hypothetical protein
VGAAAALTGVGAGISAIGSLGSASAQREAGKAQQAQYNFKAAQEDQQATQAIAASQRQMFDTNKKTALTQSTLTARAAADGGSATDATPLDLSQDIAGRGEYLALGDLFAGEDKSAGLHQQAYADRYSGAAARAGANAQANATILGGIGSLAGKFGSLIPGGSSFG